MYKLLPPSITHGPSIFNYDIYIVLLKLGTKLLFFTQGKYIPYSQKYWWKLNLVVGGFKFRSYTVGKGSHYIYYINLVEVVAK